MRNCWGFIDGTVRSICKPWQHQQEVYNRHKKVHALKFQINFCASLYREFVFSGFVVSHLDCTCILFFVVRSCSFFSSPSEKCLALTGRQNRACPLLQAAKDVERICKPPHVAYSEFKLGVVGVWRKSVKKKKKTTTKKTPNNYPKTLGISVLHSIQVRSIYRHYTGVCLRRLSALADSLSDVHVDCCLLPVSVHLSHNCVIT